MKIESKLFQIADHLERLAKKCPSEQLDAIINSSNEIGKAWSGSWIGYQSRVYYNDLKPVSRWCSIQSRFGIRCNIYPRGDWKEYEFDKVVKIIINRGGCEDLSLYQSKAEEVRSDFENYQPRLLSLITSFDFEGEKDNYNFLKELVDKIKKEKIYTAGNYVKVLSPTGKFCISGY